MEKQFSTRRFENSDVDGIVKLFTEVFEGNFSRKWWEWKYVSNPAGFHGEEGDVWIAETNDGRVVGHWGVIPEKLKLGSKTVEVAQAVDAATHPDYRGQGIFKTLVKNVCSDAKKRYNFVFGFPNELFKGYEKLGWESYRLTEFLNFLEYNEPLRSHFKNGATAWSAKTALRILRAANILTTSLRFERQTGDDIEIEEVTRFSEEMNDFWKLVRPGYEIILERDYSFLQWRFSEKLGHYRKFIARSIKTGGITGYIIVRKTSIRSIHDVLDIVDFYSLPKEDKSLISLIKFAIEIANQEGLSVIYCRVAPWHKYATFLRRLRFVPVGRAFEYAGLYNPRMIVCPLTQKGNVDVRRWFCTLADTDYA